MCGNLSQRSNLRVADQVASVRLLTRRWESLMMEKKQEMQQWSPGRTNQGMIHHHHDHEKYDQVRCDQEQKLCDNTI